jgi:hypothetical protein
MSRRAGQKTKRVANLIAGFVGARCCPQCHSGRPGMALRACRGLPELSCRSSCRFVVVVRSSAAGPACLPSVRQLWWRRSVAVLSPPLMLVPRSDAGGGADRGVCLSGGVSRATARVFHRCRLLVVVAVCCRPLPPRRSVVRRCAAACCRFLPAALGAAPLLPPCCWCCCAGAVASPSSCRSLRSLGLVGAEAPP